MQLLTDVLEALETSDCDAVTSPVWSSSETTLGGADRDLTMDSRLHRRSFPKNFAVAALVTVGLSGKSLHPLFAHPGDAQRKRRGPSVDFSRTLRWRDGDHILRLFRVYMVEPLLLVVAAMIERSETTTLPRGLINVNLEWRASLVAGRLRYYYGFVKSLAKTLV